MDPRDLIHVCGIQLHGGVAGGGFCDDIASVKILRNPLVKRTCPGSTLHLSCRDTMSTSLAIGDPGSRLGFACCLPGMSSVG